MNLFDEKYRAPHDIPTYGDCADVGEHHGDPYEQTDVLGVVWEHWTCCTDKDVVGELVDCDTCLEPGIVAEDEDLPPGWVEDTNGSHCEKCQAPRV